MCLITYSPQGAEALDWATLDYSRKHMNDDGFGLAWYDEQDGKWNPMRSMRSHKLLSATLKIPQDAPLVIHQRYATHGVVDMSNCHPFVVAGALLFHNGTIDGTRASSRTSYKNAKGEWVFQKPDISDTRAFCEDELEPMLEAAGHDWLLDKRGVNALAARIGGGSVLAICLPQNPHPVLVNMRRGDWEKHDGNLLYYSNSYARPYGSYGAYGGAAYGWENDPDYGRNVVRYVNGQRISGNSTPGATACGVREGNGVTGGTALVVRNASPAPSNSATGATQSRAEDCDADEARDVQKMYPGLCAVNAAADAEEIGEQAANERWREHEKDFDREWAEYMARDAEAYQAEKIGRGKLVGEG